MIDERTTNQYGDYTQRDRGMYARLVDTLCVSENIRPAVISFDNLFSIKETLSSNKH